MSKKLLISTICSGTLLLTACGGGGDDSQPSFDGKEKLDYKKIETTHIITEPVVNLSNSSENLLFYIGMLAQGIYESTSNSDFLCETGTVKINSDKSVTLNNCKNFKIPSQGTQFSGIISGTVQSNNNNTTAVKKKELNLSNLNIDLTEDTLLFNGKIIHTSTLPNSDLLSDTYETEQSTLKYVEKINNKDYYLYTLNNYQFISKYYILNDRIEDFAKGKINGEFNGKVFSVNFASNFNFSTAEDLFDFKPNSANVEITDQYNQKNTISIHQATNGAALVNTYADGKLVQTFSQDWNEF
ncbi:hypothetical protein MMP66_01805 [Acinetobacter dispersus]|uniref:hypothetical protein n=1 Tax=Acinetobacter dispersus TaxID=70348 RepID=UPI001F4A22A0|nr:hypothetical protein [Acinetobacter dispersus]MCH7393012.1 hypothetical protein [Acinetobacter dispersus]